MESFKVELPELVILNMWHDVEESSEKQTTAQTWALSQDRAYDQVRQTQGLLKGKQQ